MSYTTNEIKIANSTNRANGCTAIDKNGVIRSVVARYVENNVDKTLNILDYGSGKNIIQTKYLREKGFCVTAYDFGANCIEGVHDKDALSKQYSVVMASNVLNVQSSLDMLLTTLNQIYNSLESGGEFICNYPASPRKLLLAASDLREILQSIFKGRIERVGGTASAPLWKVQKRHFN